jgi:hypothetical protein
LATILTMVAPKPIHHRRLQFLTIRRVKLPHLGRMRERRFSSLRRRLLAGS